MLFIQFIVIYQAELFKKKKIFQNGSTRGKHKIYIKTLFKYGNNLFALLLTFILIKKVKADHFTGRYPILHSTYVSEQS